MQVLVDHQIKHSMVSGITPDGAADGQCGLRLIDTLRDKVDTCMLHQLQRAVLWCLGKTGRTCQNSEAQDLLRKNARIVMLSRQSLGTNKHIKQLQRDAGVPRHLVWTLVPRLVGERSLSKSRETIC